MPGYLKNCFITDYKSHQHVRASRGISLISRCFGCSPFHYVLGKLWVCRMNVPLRDRTAEPKSRNQSLRRQLRPPELTITGIIGSHTRFEAHAAESDDHRSIHVFHQTLEVFSYFGVTLILPTSTSSILHVSVCALCMELHMTA